MKRSYILIIVVSLVLVTGCNNNPNSIQSETSITDTLHKQKMGKNNLIDFGLRYAQAWCSQKPESVAAFFSADGSLTVNNGTPAVGRDSISKVAKGFMTAFPDMIVTMDSLPATSNGIEFHWTLTGTNTGPGGTGKKVKISGVEVWQLDDKGLIQNSLGSFNEDEYNRQLKYGADK